MIIDPLVDIPLSHRAYHLAVSVRGDIAAVAADGTGSFVRAGETRADSFRIRPKPSAISISPDGNFIAVAEATQVTLLSSGTLQGVHRLHDAFDSAHFSGDGFLWTCTRLYDDAVVLEVWEPVTWTRTARTRVSDPYGDSRFFLLPHPDPNCVVIWAAAGQDGQSLIWSRHENATITAERFPDLVETVWPSFSPSGEEFLVISWGELQRYKYPRGPRNGAMVWQSEDETEQMGDFVAYVNEHRALLQSTSERLYLVDLDSWTIVDEVCIREHERDVFMFVPCAEGGFVSVHRERSADDPRDSRDRLLKWKID